MSTNEEPQVGREREYYNLVRASLTVAPMMFFFFITCANLFDRVRTEPTTSPSWQVMAIFLVLLTPITMALFVMLFIFRLISLRIYLTSPSMDKVEGFKWRHYVQTFITFLFLGAVVVTIFGGQFFSIIIGVSGMLGLLLIINGFDIKLLMEKKLSEQIKPLTPPKPEEGIELLNEPLETQEEEEETINMNQEQVEESNKNDS